MNSNGFDVVNDVSQKNVDKRVNVLTSRRSSKMTNLAFNNIISHIGINFIYQKRIVHPVIMPKINALTIQAQIKPFLKSVYDLLICFQVVQVVLDFYGEENSYVLNVFSIYQSNLDILCLSTKFSTLFSKKKKKNALKSSIFLILSPPSYLSLHLSQAVDYIVLLVSLVSISLLFVQKKFLYVLSISLHIQLVVLIQFMKNCGVPVRFNLINTSLPALDRTRFFGYQFMSLFYFYFIISLGPLRINICTPKYLPILLKGAIWRKSEIFCLRALLTHLEN